MFLSEFKTSGSRITSIQTINSLVLRLYQEFGEKRMDASKLKEKSNSQSNAFNS